MRLAYLAILITSVYVCRSTSPTKHGPNSDVLQATFPESLTSSEGSKTPVDGPITSEASASGVMDAPSGTGSLPPKESDHTPKNNQTSTVLTDDGTADKVQSKTLSQEKIEGTANWGFKDLFKPECTNCKAVLDYKRLLNEYGSNYGTRPLLFIAMIFCIWLLGTTARDFFVPPLLYWSERLRLSPEIAGATLLAFGNDAPDVFAVVTAARNNDLPLAVSEMLGANMFAICVTGSCVALSIWYYKESAAAAGQLADDEMLQQYSVETETNTLSNKTLVITVSFYLITVATLAYVLFEGSSTPLKTLFMPFLYMLYVFALWWFRDKTEIESTIASVDVESPDAKNALYGVLSEGGSGDAFSIHEPPLEGIAMEKNGGPLDLAWWWLKLPAYTMRYACIPAIDSFWGPVRRATSAFSPLGMLIFCLSTNVGYMQSMNVFALIGFGMLACLSGLSVFFCSDNRFTLPWFYPVLALFALVASIVWMAVLASEITALVEAIGFIMSVPRLRLGYTAVAWGNSLTDLMVCMATVQKGQASMAMTAIFAAPLLNDLIAFGTSVLVVSLSQNKIPVVCGADCPEEFRGPLITSLSMLSVAVVLLACMLREKSWRIKIWAGMLATLYVAFLILVLFVEKVDAPEAKKAIKVA